MPEWTLRLLIAALLVLAGWAIYRMLLIVALHRASKVESVLQATSPGQTTIVYFTTPDCAPCKTVQRPALNRLKTVMGERLRVVEINAYEQPEQAKAWGVMSVPATFILDARGKPRQANFGATPFEKLARQVEQVAGGAGTD